VLTVLIATAVYWLSFRDTYEPSVFEPAYGEGNVHESQREPPKLDEPFGDSSQLTQAIHRIELLESRVSKLTRQLKKLKKSNRSRRPQMAKPEKEEMSATEFASSNPHSKPTMSELFVEGDHGINGDGANIDDIEIGLHNSATENFDIGTLECRGKLCRAEYTYYGSGDAETEFELLTENISSNIEGDIGLYYEEENGINVIYIEVE